MGSMGDADADWSAAEAALGLNPELFINEVLNTVDDIRHEAFEYCLQEAAPEAVGAATATQKAAELERGVNDIHYLVKDVLDRRMENWEKYCLHHCFTIPEGFMVPEDASSSAKESHSDRNSDSDLDAELDSLRGKLQNANNESAELQMEISYLETQNVNQKSFDSSIAEALELFEDNTFQDLMKTIPIFYQKIKGMKRKKAEFENMVDQNDWSAIGFIGHNRTLGFITSTEDVKEVARDFSKE